MLRLNVHIESICLHQISRSFLRTLLVIEARVPPGWLSMTFPLLIIYSGISILIENPHDTLDCIHQGVHDAKSNKFPIS